MHFLAGEAEEESWEACLQLLLGHFFAGVGDHAVDIVDEFFALLDCGFSSRCLFEMWHI